jgi:Cu+-exporting ATPase
MTGAGNTVFDELLLVRIKGMHCHRCEETIRRSLARHSGVYEVEVDFPSGQASILFNPASLTATQLIGAISGAGYEIIGFTELHADPGCVPTLHAS